MTPAGVAVTALDAEGRSAAATPPALLGVVRLSSALWAESAGEAGVVSGVSTIVEDAESHPFSSVRRRWKFESKPLSKMGDK